VNAHCRPVPAYESQGWEPMCLCVSAVAAAVRPPELGTGALHVGSDGWASGALWARPSWPGWRAPRGAR
jgi:hypothetical protein